MEKAKAHELESETPNQGLLPDNYCEKPVKNDLHAHIYPNPCFLTNQTHTKDTNQFEVQSSNCVNKCHSISMIRRHSLLVSAVRLCVVGIGLTLLLVLLAFNERLDRIEKELEDLRTECDYSRRSDKTSRIENTIREWDKLGTFRLENPEENVFDLPNPSIAQQRVKRRIDHSKTTKTSKHAGSAHVEFMYPNGNDDVEDGPGDQNGQIRQQNNNNSSGDSVLLTSYSKIPLTAIQDFCSKTREYCPASPAGPPGPKGEIGLPGDRGHRGHPGFSGAPGLRGPKGESGHSGLDGRDGLPGEPGLDGIPGRNGMDGIPGLEGTPGRDGISGKDGKNGTDGRIGPAGPQGLQGIRGLTGPMGPQGTPGRDGIPGYSGVNATFVTGSGQSGKIPESLWLIPPSIVGIGSRMRPLVVTEGERNVGLQCIAAGNPDPKIKWKREDGYPIKLGSWTVSSVEGPMLNFTKVNRVHMGNYICIAENSVSPPAQKVYQLEVHFPPMIEVKNQQTGVILGKTGSLECVVESFPRGIVSWQTGDGKWITTNDTKFQTSSIDFELYKTRMILNITRTNRNDLGKYHCIAKNPSGSAKGQLNLVEWSPNLVIQPTYLVTPPTPSVIYGKKPPDLLDISSDCPPPKPCENCPKRIEPARCITGGYQLIDKLAWDITPLKHFKLPDESNRTELGSCQLSAVGKPVFHGFANETCNWMRETYLNDSTDYDKYWATLIHNSSMLFEYENKAVFMSRDPKLPASKEYILDPEFQGNFHTIYNGSFYYVAEGDENDNSPLVVIRYNLARGMKVEELELPSSSNLAGALYSAEPGSNVGHTESKVDLSVDENGLWAIYTLPNQNSTAIVKIEFVNDQMTINYGWNITISHKHAGDMFIICGVLYAVDSVTERDTKIRLALDLYKKQLIKTELPFTNPFSNTLMVSYNPKFKELLTIDGGKLLIYPVKHSALTSSILTQDENN